MFRGDFLLGKLEKSRREGFPCYVGDTLFALGCGRLFEGTPAQMTDSLGKFVTLPAETQVCCAHEYTLANLRWALTVDPANRTLLQTALGVGAGYATGLAGNNNNVAVLALGSGVTTGAGQALGGTEQIKRTLRVKQGVAVSVFVANPHVFTLEDGSRHKRADADQIGFKAQVDPYGLLNPGKMRSYTPSRA